MGHSKNMGVLRIVSRALEFIRGQDRKREFTEPPSGDNNVISSSRHESVPTISQM